MNILIWLVIAILFILSFVGLLVPVIPSSLALWGGFLVYHFFIDSGELGLSFYLVMLVFTLVLFISDLITNRHFVNRYGGSKPGEYAGMIGLIVGAFILPPFGLILIPFASVFLVELILEKTMKEALSASIGSLIGFLSSLAIKVILHILMIVIFFLYLIF